MTNNNKQIAKYLAADFISASVVWVLFNILRFYQVALYDGFDKLVDYITFAVVWEVQIAVPFFWLALYYFSGYYNKPVAKSRLKEFFITFASATLGVTLLFFIIILDDLPRSFHIYYQLFFFLLGVQFLFTYSFRASITLAGLRRIRRREVALNVLIIGAGAKAKKISGHLFDEGYNIAGFATEAGETETAIPPEQVLGNLDGLPEIVAAKRIDEIVVAIESNESEKLLAVLYLLYRYKCPVKILADKPNMLPNIRIKTIRGLPLVDVTDNNFSEAEKNIKLWADKVAAALALVLLLPVYIYIMYRVRKESPGPALFRQERIGYRGKPFRMYKFRTMYMGAEDNGPLLSSDSDGRITPFGRLMRKYRLDELPQFWNVLKGDMSLVGPRPERKHFIDKIVRKAPYYYLLHNVRPGITSLGMVKYGYACNVDEMVERLEYDMLYYENMSLVMDLTILAYTVNTVITGKGI
ncbi:undecaprenyl-phosphate glucose phosphotransferase [Bacteroidia bacterium]|nr:undecaprenyl-phosphate glucose phosphotransferase [Bacteroidia bacterium]